VAKYIYRVNGAEIDFTPDEIIHFRRPHANDPLWGLGEIESGESLYDDHINRSLYNSRFMANGAMPSGVLVNENYDGSAEEWEKMKSSFADKYTGVRNSGKVAWMNGKWTLLQMGITAQAMQELEKSNTNIEHIFLNHGVPLSVAGFTSRNFATARQEDINFRKYTVLSKLNLFADAMNSSRGFIQAFNPELKLDFSLAGLIDVEQVAKDYAPLFDRAGISPNDFRELCGLQRANDPMLDQHFCLNTYVPIEIAGVAMEDPALTSPKPGAKPTDKPKPNASGDGEDATDDTPHEPTA